jgi:hypothetical protein
MFRRHISMESSFIRFKAFTGSDLSILATVQLGPGVFLPRVGEKVTLPGMPPMQVYEVVHEYAAQVNIDIYLTKWVQK